jgi:hypothetical protein
MSESEKPSAKVVNLFSRETVKGEDRLPPAPPELVAALSTNVDRKSMETLDSVMKSVVAGDLSGICAFGTNKAGLGQFFISVRPGESSEAACVRYLGLIAVFQNILISMAMGTFDQSDAK